jgi:hypothetical protein
MLRLAGSSSESCLHLGSIQIQRWHKIGTSCRSSSRSTGVQGVNLGRAATACVHTTIAWVMHVSARGFLTKVTAAGNGSAKQLCNPQGSSWGTGKDHMQLLPNRKYLHTPCHPAATHTHTRFNGHESVRKRAS